MGCLCLQQIPELGPRSSSAAGGTGACCAGGVCPQITGCTSLFACCALWQGRMPAESSAAPTSAGKLGGHCRSSRCHRFRLRPLGRLAGLLPLPHRVARPAAAAGTKTEAGAVTSQAARNSKTNASRSPKHSACASHVAEAVARAQHRSQPPAGSGCRRRRHAAGTGTAGTRTPCSTQPPPPPTPPPTPHPPPSTQHPAPSTAPSTQHPAPSTQHPPPHLRCASCAIATPSFASPATLAAASATPAFRFRASATGPWAPPNTSCRQARQAGSEGRAVGGGQRPPQRRRGRSSNAVQAPGCAQQGAPSSRVHEEMRLPQRPPAHTHQQYLCVERGVAPRQVLHRAAGDAQLQRLQRVAALACTA